MAAGLQRSGLGTEALKSLRDVGGLDTLEVGTRRREDTIGHGGDDAVAHELLYPTGIAKLLVLLPKCLIDDVTQLCLSLSGEGIILSLEEVMRYLHELVGTIVFELIAVGEAAAESGVGAQHVIHLLGVACQNDEHVGVGPCEDGEQRLDDAMAEVLAVWVVRDEVVGLVDEEHVATRLFEHHLHIVLCLSQVLTYQTGAVYSNQVALGEESERVVDLTKLTGDGGLARARVAREDHVVGGAASTA